MLKKLIVLLVLISCWFCKAEIDELKRNKQIIYLNEKSTNTIRLKSVISLSKENSITTSMSHLASAKLLTKPKILWQFRRIYSMPNFINPSQEINNKNTNYSYKLAANSSTMPLITSSFELSQLEVMISLGAEVESNLEHKYSIDLDDEANGNYDLVIKNLTHADSGLYMCNLWNQKAVYYQLIVSSSVEKPDIYFYKLNNEITNGGKIIIKEASNVSLKCATKNVFPYPQIKWFHNDKEILSYEEEIEVDFRLVDKETNSIESELTVLNVSSAWDQSNFTCKLMQLGEAKPLRKLLKSAGENYANEQQLWQSSEQISLNVSFKPVVTVEVVKAAHSTLPTYFNYLNLYNESDIIFRCQYKSNPIKAKIIWKINDIPQVQTGPNNHEFHWNRRSNRFDKNVKNMQLTCEVENQVGIASFTHQITLIYEPRISVANSILDVDELSPVRVKCEVDGSPEPVSIEWRRSVYPEGANDGNNNYVIVNSGSVLDLKSVRHLEHSGVYECAARNLMKDSFGEERRGESSATIELNVRFSPQISVQFHKIAVNLNQSFQNITCKTAANPAPLFNWYKNGAKLNTLQQSKYLIGSVTARNKNLYENGMKITELNEGDLNSVYECEAVNVLGSNKAKVELVAQSQPERPSELKAVHVDFMSVSFTWVPGFDGGLEQYFQIQLNDSILTNENEVVKINTGPYSVNITNLKPDTVYSIRMSAVNKIGSSEWSETIIVKTNDLTTSHSSLIPVLESLYLNVPKNRLEFKVDRVSSVKFCLKINVTLNENGPRFEMRKCFLMRNFNQFLFDELDKEDLRLDSEKSPNSTRLVYFNAQRVKEMKVSLCFYLKESICSAKPTSAVIDTYNRISHSSHLTNNNNLNVNSSNETSHLTSPIPIALVIGICVCILALIVLLFFTVIYCIRKKNFKICKALLNHGALSQHSQDKPIDSKEEKKTPHTNKTFNIDIASISAPVALSETHLVSGSVGRRTFAGALSATASNIINKHKFNEILVTEDEDKIKKTALHVKTIDEDKNSDSSRQISSSNTSSTAVSNCSNPNPHFVFAEYNDRVDYTTTAQTHIDVFNNNNNNNKAFADTYNSGASSGTNSDPIAINNSISSNSTVDSPTYGYNIAAASVTNINSTKHLLNEPPQQPNNSDNLLYIKATSKNFTLDEQTASNFSKQGSIVRQQKMHRHSLFQPSQAQNPSACVKHNSFHVSQGYNNEAPESGYSTPSRPKKVVYEVIV